MPCWHWSCSKVFYYLLRKQITHWYICIVNCACVFIWGYSSAQAELNEGESRCCLWPGTSPCISPSQSLLCITIVFLPFSPIAHYLYIFQEPVFSSTYSPPLSLGQKCQYIEHHSQVRTCTWHAQSSCMCWTQQLAGSSELLVIWLHQHEHDSVSATVGYVYISGMTSTYSSALECIKSFYIRLATYENHVNYCWEANGRVTWWYNKAVCALMKFFQGCCVRAPFNKLGQLQYNMGQNTQN